MMHTMVGGIGEKEMDEVIARLTKRACGIDQMNIYIYIYTKNHVDSPMSLRHSSSMPEFESLDNGGKKTIVEPEDALRDDDDDDDDDEEKTVPRNGSCVHVIGTGKSRCSTISWSSDTGRASYSARSASSILCNFVFTCSLP